MQQKYLLFCCVLVVDGIGPLAPIIGDDVTAATYSMTGGEAITFMTPRLGENYINFIAPMPAEGPVTFAAP
ncbi:hypothetical protein MTO96_044366, partial [Rhipicephalus appendiculatus]